MSDINYLGIVKHRNQTTKFGIRRADRRQHIYALGKSGVGKSTWLENCLFQDITAGHGVGFIDPHGDSSRRLIEAIPSTRPKDPVYFDPTDTEYPVAFNILRECSAEQRYLVTSSIVSTFKKLWQDSWGPRLEYILANSIAALAEHPEASLLNLPYLLVDADYRERIVKRVTDIEVRRFWEREFASWTDSYVQEAIGSIQNKVGALLRSPILRNILGQPTATFNVRQIMDEQQIFIANLAKGQIGEEESRLLGALLVTKFQLAAMSRADTPEEERKDFYLSIDEAPNFMTPAFTSILSEARKYRLCLTLAHQYIEQLTPEIQKSIFGNTGTLLAFRLGADDAEVMEKEFAPQIEVQHLLDLPKYHFYIKLMIDGLAERPFMAEALPPITTTHGRGEQVKRFSRERFTKDRDDVEYHMRKSLGWE